MTMMRTSTSHSFKHSFKQLLKATTAEEIVPSLVQCCWEALGNEGEPPNLDLLNALPCELDHLANIRGAFDRNFDRWQSETYSHLFDYFRAIGLEVQSTPIEQWNLMDDQQRDQAVHFVWENDVLLFSETPDWIAGIIEIVAFTKVADITDETTQLFLDKYTEKQKQCAEFDRLYTDLSSLIHYITQPDTKRIPKHLRQNIEEARFERFHSFWKFCYRRNDSLPHLFAPMVRAWLTEQIAKPIPREYERKHPGSILPEKSIATVRYPRYETTGEVPTTSTPAPSASQLILPTFERKMYLPEYLPIQIVQGVDMTGRANVLPYPMRFFFEVGMSLKPKQRKGWYTKKLYHAAEDIGIVDKTKGKYLTARAKQSIHNALVVLKEVYIPYIANPGGKGLHQPFYTQSIPTQESGKDFPIRVEITLPPDDKGGVLVETQIVRGLYQNLAQLNAYLAACVLFNQHGRNPQNQLINPTEPDPKTPRLESGQIVNPTTGKPLFTARGKPVTDILRLKP